MGGVPCVRGTRIPVATVVGMVAEGMSTDEILDALFRAAHPSVQAIADSDTVVGGTKERGAPVVRIRLEANELRFREHIRDPLDALSRHSHAARNLRHGASGSDRPENLPPRPRLLLGSSDPFDVRLPEAREGKRFLEDTENQRLWHS